MRFICILRNHCHSQGNGCIHVLLSMPCVMPPSRPLLIRTIWCLLQWSICQNLLFIFKTPFRCLLFFFFFTTPQGKMCGFLNLQPEIKSVPLAVEAWSANHWEPGKPLVVFLWLSFRSCLYIFICKYFLPDCYLSLRSLNHVSKRVDIFCFFLVQCVSFFFHVSCFWYLRNFCLTQGCNDFSPMFLLRVLLF